MHACIQTHTRTVRDADFHTHTQQPHANAWVSEVIGGSRQEVEMGGKKMKAPLFCVPLRLYRLVSPVHDQHLCLFQKLQTQSPESVTLAAGRGIKRRKEEMDTHTHAHTPRHVHTEEERKGQGGEEEKKGW